MASAGLVVFPFGRSVTLFWSAVPETGKRAVFPGGCLVHSAANLRQFVEELRRKDDEETATPILETMFLDYTTMPPRVAESRSLPEPRRFGRLMPGCWARPFGTWDCN